MRHEADPVLSVSYGIKEFSNHLSLSLYGEVGGSYGNDSSFMGLGMRETELQLSYPIKEYKATLTANLLKLNSVKFGFSRKTHYGRIGLATEYFGTGQSVLSIGYRIDAIQNQQEKFQTVAASTGDQ